MQTRLVVLFLLLALLMTSYPTVLAQDSGINKPYAYEAVDMANGAELLRARAQTIDLSTYPVIPKITPFTHKIYMQGQAAGRTPQVVSKVGDCNSVGWLFLHPFGENQYDLGHYTELQATIDFFGESLAYRTYAAQNGLNVAAALDPLWADPGVCNAGETPLACEYRLHNPSIAVIMFGTNDLLALTPEQFDRNLRRIIQSTREKDVIPILSTFPRHLSYPQRSILFNQLVVRIALDFNIPLINLWRALELLPAHGIADDGFHLNGPITGAGDFASEKNLQTGFPQRNLVTLQTLARVWHNVIQPQQLHPPITPDR